MSDFRFKEKKSPGDEVVIMIASIRKYIVNFVDVNLFVTIFHKSSFLLSSKKTLQQNIHAMENNKAFVYHSLLQERTYNQAN